MSQLRNLVKEMLPLPDEVKDDEGNIQSYEERKANNEAMRLYYEQELRDLMLELVGDMEERETSDMTLKSWAMDDYKAFGRNELRCELLKKIGDL